MRQAEPLRRPPALVLQQRHGQPVGHDVEHGDAQVRSLAAAAARDQRLQDRRVRGGAGRDVDHRDTDPRHPGPGAGQRRQAALGLHQQVVGLAMGQRPVVAVAGDGAADQARVLAAQPIDAQAHAGQRPGLEVLHEHVGAGDHPP